MRKNFSKFLMNTAMFELSCDPCTAKLFTAAPAPTASKLLLRKRKLPQAKTLAEFFLFRAAAAAGCAPRFMVYRSKDHAAMRCMMVAISARVMVDFGANTLPGLPCTRPVFAQ